MTNELVRKVISGEIRHSEYARYIADVYCYARHSAIVIAAAGTRLVGRQDGLADYLFAHAREEIGHEAWAREDLLDLGWSATRIEEVRPSRPCQEMIALEYFYAFHANPVGLFGWMYVLECFGGDAAGGIARRIDESLDLGGKAIRFLGGHGEADAVHSEDLTRVIVSAKLSENDVECLTGMAALSLEKYLGILDSAVEGARANEQAA